MDQLFAPDDDGPRRTRTGVPAREAPLAVRLRPRTVDEVVGQQHLLGIRDRAAARDRGGAAALDDPLRAAGDRQDDARAPRRGDLAGGVRGGERRRGGTPRGAQGTRARGAPAQGDGRADDLLPRRDPPLQQGAAGRAAAGRRGGARHADRRDDREPVLRGQRRPAVARAGLRASRAHRGRRRGPAAAGAGPRRAAAASPPTTRR